MKNRHFSHKRIVQALGLVALGPDVVGRLMISRATRST
jgi:hypothetical protein